MTEPLTTGEAIGLILKWALYLGTFIAITRRALSVKKKL